MIGIGDIIKIIGFFIYYPFIKGNEDFIKIILDFRAKFPPSQKRGFIHAQEKSMYNIIDNSPTGNSCIFTTYNMSTLKSEMSQSIFDEFMKRFEDFKCYKLTIFNKKIITYRNNVLRFQNLDLKNMIDEKGYKIQTKTDFQVLCDIIHDDDNIPNV